MIEILIGTVAILGIFIIAYIFGIVPNLWSKEIISYTSIEDVLLRGFKNLVLLCGIITIILVIWGIGWIILTALKG